MDAIINWSLLVFVLALAALPLFLGLAAGVGYITKCAVRRLTVVRHQAAAAAALEKL